MGHNKYFNRLVSFASEEISSPFAMLETIPESCIWSAVTTIIEEFDPRLMLEGLTFSPR